MNRTQAKNRRNQKNNPFSALLSSRINAICQVADAWLQPASPWMKQARKLVSQNSPYSPEMVEACLTQTFHGYTRTALGQWVSHKKISPIRNKKILVVLPSTVMAAAWQSATTVWLTGGHVVLKPSSRERAFATLLAKSVRSMVEKSLPITVLPPSRTISNSFKTIIVYGSDETIRNLQHSKRKIIGFGSKISLAYVSRKKSASSLIQKAAFDSVLYDTQGCLSPQCFYVETGGNISPENFARKLAQAMNRLDHKLSQKDLENEKWASETFWQHWKFRESIEKAKTFGSHVVFHKEPGLEPSGLRRVVFVKPVKNISDFLKDCSAWVPKLSTVAVSDEKSLNQLKKKLKSHRDIRLCDIGQMHQPPPDWKNGGVNLLQILANTR